MGWFVVFPYLIQLIIYHFASSTLSLCNPHDLSSLLLFNNSFSINTALDYCSSSVYPKTASWKNGRDCCEWDGVTCNSISGHVIGLDLSCSMLEGQFHPNTTLFHLSHLQHLDLSYNHFYGDIPSKISHLSKLVSLNLSSYMDSYSDRNKMRLDPSTWNKLILNASDIRELHLDIIDMSSIRESSLSLLLNLSSSLVSLSFDFTGLQGNFPTGILCLQNLQHLALYGNWNLSGHLPKSNWSTPLTYLDLSDTSFSGEIPNSIGHLRFLNELSLSYCKFDGLIPLSFWNLTQLTSLCLSSNNLTGEISPLVSNLKHIILIDLQFNNLEGQIPSSLFNLTQLSHLDLSHNKLVGPIPSKITKFSILSYLLLGFNLLNGTIPPWCYSLPSLWELGLNDNQLTGSISEFSTYSMIGLVLSNNKLQGNFPISIYALQNLNRLDLSSNYLSGLVDFHQFSWRHISHIDLSFNQLQGYLPIPPYGIEYFSVSHNNFSGDISLTICNASSLVILNLSHNNLSGVIPQCLGNFPTLSVLDMQRNDFHGEIPRSFCEGSALETIKLNGNRLEGPLPQSLTDCKNLEVLDLGDNNIEDIFPSWLETLQELQVFSLRLNKFHGIFTCSSTKHPFPKLRIFDVSNNHFRGPLPTSYISNFQGMIDVNDSQTGLKYMTNHGVNHTRYSGFYNDSVVVIWKGESVELVRVLTSFTTIDLSNNMLEGEIPKVIGELNSLIGLNLSHNRINGTIPQSVSNLTNLEWLDLSWNNLKGKIPMALTNLNFLAFLNLSENQLEGMIPIGRQFNTFENVSYKGNPMLCGFPLSKSCNKDEGQPPQPTLRHEDDSLFGWKVVVVGYASGVVFGMLLGYTVFFTGKPQWLAILVGAIPNKRVGRTNDGAQANRRGMN